MLYGNADLLARSQSVWVAPGGTGYTSIVAAIAAVTGTAANPVIILVAPGTYVEDNPIACKSYVSILTLGGEHAATVSAANAGQHLFVAASAMMLKGLHLDGASGAGKAGVHIPAGVSEVLLDSLGFGSCSYGVLCESLLDQVDVVGCTYHDGVGTAAFSCQAGGKMNVVRGRTTASATLAHCIHTSGAGSVLSTSLGFYVGTGGATTGMEAEAWGMVQSSSDYVSGWGTSYHIAGTGGVLIASGSCSASSTTYDLHLEAGVAYLMHLSAQVGKIEIAPGANRQGDIVSADVYDPGLHVLGAFSVGYQLSGQASFFGYGRPHYHGMKILTNTNLEVGAWVDNTAAFVAGTVPTDLFAGTGVGQCLYVGGDDDFAGVTILVALALVLGGGSVTREYWNGASWVTLPGMSAQAVYPYAQYAGSTCERVGSEFLNYGDMTAWARKVLNGSNKYWIRLRVTGIITTIPKLSTIRLLQHSAEITQDGTILRHGRSRVTRDMGVSWSVMDALVGSAPGAMNIPWSANIILTKTKNRFVNGNIDGSGASIRIPEGLDTSLPVAVDVVWYPEVIPGASQIELEMRYVRGLSGGKINGTLPEAHTATITPCPAAASDRTVTQLILDLSNYLPGNDLAFSLYRDATAGNPDDTYADNLVIASIKMTGWLWR